MIKRLKRFIHKNSVHFGKNGNYVTIAATPTQYIVRPCIVGFRKVKLLPGEVKINDLKKL